MSVCLCGCKTEVKNKWVRGHCARINNPSSRADVKIKRRESSLKRIKNGERTFAGWNKGLTKESDIRVKLSGEKASKTIMSSPEKRKKKSDYAKKQWKDGNIRLLFGPDHKQWKGGTSKIQQRIRASNKFHKNWRLPVLKRDHFRCQSCGNSKNLNVHHDRELFSDILKKFIPENYRIRFSWKEENLIIENVIEYHIKNNVSGVTFCRKCHDEKHKQIKSSE